MRRRGEEEKREEAKRRRGEEAKREGEGRREEVESRVKRCQRGQTHLRSLSLKYGLLLHLDLLCRLVQCELSVLGSGTPSKVLSFVTLLVGSIRKYLRKTYFLCSQAQECCGRKRKRPTSEIRSRNRIARSFLFLVNSCHFDHLIPTGS
jgi:hypothetical protein